MKSILNQLNHSGTGYVTRIHLSMVREPERLYCNNLCSPEEVARMLTSIFKDSDREKFVVVSLAANFEPIALEVAATGSVDTCYVDIRSVCKHALLSNASGLIIAHNHPSQTLLPSKEDDLITRKIKEAAELLDFTLQDHLIWADTNSYYSYREHDWNSIG